MKKVFIVEDEILIIELIKSYLEKEGFLVNYTTTGLGAIEKIEEFKPDVLIVDLMLPEVSGEEIISQIRNKINIPILIISAKKTEESVLNGFEIGADDYIRKPFSPRELTLKIKALTRNLKEETFEIDEEKFTILYKKNKIELTKNEFAIIQLLYKNNGIVFTRDNIIESLFNDYDAYDRTIDAYIKNIRKKISKDIIKTVHGIGYKFGEI